MLCQCLSAQPSPGLSWLFGQSDEIADILANPRNPSRFADEDAFGRVSGQLVFMSAYENSPNTTFVGTDVPAV